MSTLAFELNNQNTMYLMIVLTIIFGLLTGFLTYYSNKFAHTQHGHDDEEHE